MNSIRSCKINLMQWRTNPKYAVVLGYLILYMWTLTHGYIAFSRDMGYMVRPWLFPLMPATVNRFMPVYLSFVVLISDAPFRNHQQRFVLLRVGKRNWILGQLLYLLVLSTAYTVVLWLLSWLFILPRIEWGTNWGVILTTVATDNLHLPYRVMNLSYECMMNTTPLAATAWVFFMMIGVNFLLGEILVLCNLWTKKGVGAVIVVSLVLLPFLMMLFEATPYNLSKLTWVSPVSWLSRLTLIHGNRNKPSFLYAAVMTVCLDVLLAGISIGTIHKCNLDTEEE